MKSSDSAPTHPSDHHHPGSLPYLLSPPRHLQSDQVQHTVSVDEEQDPDTAAAVEVTNTDNNPIITPAAEMAILLLVLLLLNLTCNTPRGESSSASFNSSRSMNDRPRKKRLPRFSKYEVGKLTLTVIGPTTAIIIDRTHIFTVMLLCSGAACIVMANLLSHAFTRTARLVEELGTLLVSSAFFAAISSMLSKNPWYFIAIPWMFLLGILITMALLHWVYFTRGSDDDDSDDDRAESNADPRA